MKSKRIFLLVASSLVVGLTSCAGNTLPSAWTASPSPSSGDPSSSEDPSSSSSREESSSSESSSSESSSSESSSSESPSSEEGPTFAKVIDQLHSRIAMQGSYVESYTYGSDVYPYTYNLKTILDEGIYCNVDYGNTTDQIQYFLQYYRNKDGYVVTKELNPTTNQLDESILYGTDSEGNEVPFVFDEEFGFFQTMEEDDFTYGNGVATSRDLTEAEAYSLTNSLAGFVFDDAPTNFTIHYDEEFNITSFHVEVSGNEGEEGSEDYYAYSLVIDMEVVEESTLGISFPEPRTTGSIAELDALFASLQKGNYTVTAKAASSGTGGETFVDGTIYLSDAGAIVENRLTDSTYGYMVVSEDRLAGVVLNPSDNKLYGVEPLIGETIGNLNGEFNYLSCMFDETAENEYTLLGYSNFYTSNTILEMLPDYLLTLGQYVPVVGSYILKNNLDGTWTSSYKFLYEGTSGTEEVSITSTISGIGSTSIPYTLDDYVPYKQPTSWAEVEGATTVLARFGITDELPFPNVEGLVFEVWGNASTSQVLRTTHLPIGETADTVRTMYAEQIVENGWVYSSTSEGFGEQFYTYTRDDGAKLRVGLYIQNGKFYIYLYEYTLAPSALSKWIDATFADSLNYTIDFDITRNIYGYDIDTGTIGDLTSTTNYISKLEQTDVAQVVTGTFFTTEHATIKTDTGLDQYTRDYSTESPNPNPWVKGSSVEGGSFDESFTTMKDLVGETNYLPSSDDPNVYTCSDTDILLKWRSILNTTFLNGATSYYGKEATFVFDEENNTLTASDWVMLGARARSRDESGNTIYVYVEFVVDVKLYNVGTTAIDVDAITGISAA